MENQEGSVEARRVALPAHLPQRMVAFRLGRGSNQSYVVRDKLLGKNYDFEPWQFFVLEVLPGCETKEKLASVFKDRFGYDFPEQAVDDLFGSLADSDLFNEAAHSHPLLKRYAHKGYAEDDGRPRLKSFRAPAGTTESSQVVALPQSAAPKKEPAQNSNAGDSVADDVVLPAGIQDALDYDPRRSRRLFLAFDPKVLLRVLSPVVAPLRLASLALPLLFGAALIIAFQNVNLIASDLAATGTELGFFQKAVVSMFTTNLLVTLTGALVAYRFRATVQAFGIGLVFRFLPRFSTRMSHLTQLSREERMWLHGAPLLVRASLLSAAILVWRVAREGNPLLAHWALAFSSICFVGLAISANPLLKGSGYHLLAAFANEPHLRGKALKALYGKLNGKSFKESEDVLLATYALTTVLFLFVAITVAVLALGTALRQLNLGGSGIIVATVLGFVLVRRTAIYLRQVQETYERAEQFERWRRRALPADPAAASTKTGERSWIGYLWKAAPLCLLAVSLLPYQYTPGGAFTVKPPLQQVVATDVSGLIKTVHVSGGETLASGTLIAEIDTSEAQAQADVLTAEMNEQRALIEDLKSRPRPTDVALAQRALSVAETKSKFAKLQLDRVEKLFIQEVIAAEELDEARSDYEVAVGQVEEKRAAVQVAKDGPTPEQIAAAEAKWESLKAERGTYLTRIEHSKLKMPFDGRLLTLNLKERGNAYYEKGEPFAAAEVAGPVTAEIEIPESDMQYVQIGDPVRIRPKSHSDSTLTGKVQTIDWKVTERPFGNVVKVIAVVEGEGDLRNGMSGYAKVEGEELPVWKAFSLALIRFFQVEIWSWIP